MRPKSLILLALALGCGLIASIGISQMMENRSHAKQNLPEMQPVLVALRDIERTEKLTPENVGLKDFPKANVPPSAVTDFTKIDGMRPGQRLVAGEMILQGDIGSGDASSTHIPAGYRSVPVKVDSTTGGAGLILPGDRVDVQVTARRNPAAGINESGTWTFLQDVSVFAVNAAIQTDPDDPNKVIDAKTISLLVTPEQAAKVTTASELGRIRLVLRGSGDEGAAEKHSASWGDVVGKTEKLGEDLPLAAEPPITPPQFAEPAVEPAPALPPVEEKKPFQMVIHEGSKVRVVQFNNGSPDPVDVTDQQGNLFPIGAPASATGTDSPGSAGFDDSGFNPTYEQPSAEPMKDEPEHDDASSDPHLDPDNEGVSE